MTLNEKLETVSRIADDDKAVGSMPIVMLDAEKRSEEQDELIDKAREEGPHVDEEDLIPKETVKIDNPSYKSMKLVERVNDHVDNIIEYTQSMIGHFLTSAKLEATEYIYDRVAHMLEGDDIDLERARATCKVLEKTVADRFQMMRETIDEDIRKTLGSLKTTSESLTEAKKKEDVDLWTKVYDELAAELDPQDTQREIKARANQRYRNIYPGDDINDIEVRVAKIEDLDFGKRVAEHYGVAYTIREDRFAKNPDHRIVMTFKIPEESISK